MSPAARAHRLGPDPSITDVLKCMEHMSSQVAQQTDVETAVLQCITYETSSAELTEIAQYIRGTLTFCQHFRCVACATCMCEPVPDTFARHAPHAFSVLLCPCVNQENAAIALHQVRQRADSPEVDREGTDMFMRQVNAMREVPS